MKLEEAMRAVKTKVDGALKEFFAGKRVEAEKIHPSVVELVDQVADVTLRGGKRTRPFLAWVGYHAISKIKNQRSKIQIKNQILEKEIPKEPLLAMVGLELFQTFALIHDDIMDEDKKRRGGPTIQEHFSHQRELKFASTKNVVAHFYPERSRRVSARYGQNMAILAGDLALTWADIAISKIKNQRSKMIYQKMKEEVIYGQTLDVLLRVEPLSDKGSTLMKSRSDELKTAWYSVVRPLMIGSALRFAQGKLQVPDDVLGIWVDYGVPVGRLFQLRDDVTDGELSEEAFEKKARPLEKQAHKALETLETSIEVKQLLADFVIFVQNRKS